MIKALMTVRDNASNTKDETANDGNDGTDTANDGTSGDITSDDGAVNDGTDSSGNDADTSKDGSETNDGSTTKDTDSNDKAKADSSDGKTTLDDNTEFEHKIPVTEGKDRLLSRQELKTVEEDLNSIRFNGFTSQEFSSPEDIYWDEVFYNEAMIETPGIDRNKIEQEYMEKMGWDELYIEIGWIGKPQVEEFMEETSGIPANDAKHPLTWEYLPDDDIYVSAHGDTNYMPITLDSGTIEGDEIHLYYTVTDYDSYEHPFELIIKETATGYRFISNLWTPPEGRDEAVRKVYEQVITEYENGIRDHLSGEQFIERNMSPVASWTYTKNASDGRDPLELTGYYMEDLNHDGYDELIIGEITQDKIMPVFEIRSIRLGSWSRVCMSNDDFQYYLAQDGCVYEYNLNEATRYESLIKERLESAYHFLVPVEGVIRSPMEDDSGTNPYFFVKDSITPREGDHISKEMYKGYFGKAQKEYRDIPYTTFE
ncbi:MAG: hypothetical protein II799_02920 [Lachnospiraceae bacterium]|nr:hypothetical protein [Lachnospiraceae bacterium]